MMCSDEHVEVRGALARGVALHFCLFGKAHEQGFCQASGHDPGTGLRELGLRGHEVVIRPSGDGRL